MPMRKEISAGRACGSSRSHGYLAIDLVGTLDPTEAGRAQAELDSLAATLKPLWSFNAGSLSTAAPMTYSVNGKQYVAVLIGGATTAQGVLVKTPGYKDLQNTSMLYVFAL